MVHEVAAGRTVASPSSKRVSFNTIALSTIDLATRGSNDIVQLTGTVVSLVVDQSLDLLPSFSKPSIASDASNP